ncbi:hypothetical protein KKF61_07575 [Patescibacteria group bacterium]|nr:hypothetical protein [Patescibacteria group bacterium]
MPEEPNKGQVVNQPGQPGVVDSPGQPKVAPEPEPSQLPEDAKVKLADGRVVTFGELQKGNMLDADYRKKTTALAEEKRRLEEEKARLTQRPTSPPPRYGGPEAYNEGDGEEQDPVVLLAKEIQGVKAFQAHQLLSAEIDRVAKDFPDADRETVYKICWANPYNTDIREEMQKSHEKIVVAKTPPKDKYLDLTDAQARAKYEEEVIAKYNANKLKGGGAGGFAGGGAGNNAVVEPGQPPKDFDDAKERLKAALKSQPPE